MKINAFEYALVDNPARRFLMRRTFSRFRAWCPRDLGHVLEIGCGPGAGILQIDAYFHPSRIDAFDLDEKMVARAGRLAGRARAEVDLQVLDAERIPYADASFDAVFELTIFHHIPDWRAAMKEAARVLKPGGMFLFEELVREFHFDVPVVSFVQQRFTDHPWATIPDRSTFLAELPKAGLLVEHLHDHPIKGWIAGAARKPA
ncbi:methyltransferase domain-containing protein [bacterium]|nr:methyltransferase domain-containing protein [bacterium]